MKHIIALFILATIPNLNSYTQCILVDFTSKDTVCLNEAVKLYNYSESGDQYQWYTCRGNLLNNTNSNQINVGNNAFRASYGFTYIGENNVHYGITIRNAGLVYRFVYNNELSQISDLVQLPDQRTYLSLPRNIKVLKSNDNYIGIITNSGGSINITRLNYGNSILNDPTYDNIASMTPFTNTNGLEIIEESGNFYAFAGKNTGNELAILNFGNDLMNDPSVTTFSIAEASGITGISLTKYCGIYYGLVTSYANNKLFILTFDLGIDQAPSIDEITVADANFTKPARVRWVVEKGDFFAFIQTDGGDIFRLFFSNSPGKAPSIDVIPELSENCYAFDIIETKDGKFKYLAVDYINATKGLFGLSFDNQCITDGVVSEEYNPTNLSFNEPGNQIIKLVVTDDQGNFNSKTDTIYVRDQVSPETYLTTEGNCISMPIEFTLSSEAIEDIDSLLWDFDDGIGTSNELHPSYTYPVEANYQPSAIIYYSNGCSNYTSDSVYIYNPPAANFSYPETIICSNNEIVFQNDTKFSGPDSLLSFQWNTNNEAIFDTTDLNYTFTSGGQKEVSLTADLTGCISEVTKTIDITPGPLTSFDFNGACVYDTYAFTNNTTGDDITGYLWDFGDGYSSTNISPAHHYESGGTYAVSLTASNILGCNTTIQRVVPVYFTPAPNFTNDMACADNSVIFYDQSSVTDANITDQYWTLTNDDLDYSEAGTGPSPSFQLGNDGNYQMKLIAISNYGCADTLVRNDIFVRPSPKANFSVTKTCFGDSTIFNERVELPAEVSINSVEWIIDRNIYSENEVKLKFPSPGAYNAELYVRADNYCMDYTSDTISILPLPEIGIDLSSYCADQPVTIGSVINSADPVIAYHWQINSKPISNLASFVYDFKKADQYQVNLGVTTENNCYNFQSQEITIHPSPVSEFELFPSIGANPLNVSFTDLSQGASKVTYDFSVDNDDTSEDFNPIYTYTRLGNDWPKQIAENEFGCTDTSYSEIQVVVPVYDLAITETKYEVSNQKLKLVVELANNGTIIINNPELKIDIDEKISLFHQLKGRLWPGDDKVFTIDFDVILKNESLNYICFTVNTDLGDYSDVHPFDNTECLSLEGSFNVLEPYPNPSKEFVYLPIILPSPGNCEILMTNEKGAIVLKKEYKNLDEGLNLFKVDLVPYNQGLYMFVIKHAQFENTKKIVIN